MTTVAEIADAVKRLPKNDLARFRKWFLQYDAAASARGLWHLHGRDVRQNVIHQLGRALTQIPPSTVTPPSAPRPSALRAHRAPEYETLVPEPPLLTLVLRRLEGVSTRLPPRTLR
jgi:hypothetical protein